MTISFEFIEKDSCLVATIPDRTLNTARTKSILDSIGSECQKKGCCKALLNELTVEKRNFESHEIRAISEHMPDIYLAFLCQPELIDNMSKLFSAFTFNNRYRARHFDVESEALKWLRSLPDN